MSLPKELTPQETAAVLQRILGAVEIDRRSRWIEITCAVLLSLATTASAWCAYQASLWSGAQIFRLAAANKAGLEASSNYQLAIQAKTFDAAILILTPSVAVLSRPAVARLPAWRLMLRKMRIAAFDGTMFISYMEAKSRGDQKMMDLLLPRFRPDTRLAVDAWLKLDTLNKASAPASPVDMPRYAQPQFEESKRQGEISAQRHATARQASNIADNYVLMTVLLASVLFFAGIGGTFDAHRLRITVLVIALALLSFTLIRMAMLPICRE